MKVFSVKVEARHSMFREFSIDWGSPGGVLDQCQETAADFHLAYGSRCNHEWSSMRQTWSADAKCRGFGRYEGVDGRLK